MNELKELKGFFEEIVDIEYEQGTPFPDDILDAYGNLQGIIKENLKSPEQMGCNNDNIVGIKYFLDALKGSEKYSRWARDILGSCYFLSNLLKGVLSRNFVSRCMDFYKNSTSRHKDDLLESLLFYINFGELDKILFDNEIRSGIDVEIITGFNGFLKSKDFDKGSIVAPGVHDCVLLIVQGDEGIFVHHFFKEDKDSVILKKLNLILPYLGDNIKVATIGGYPGSDECTLRKTMLKQEVWEKFKNSDNDSWPRKFLKEDSKKKLEELVKTHRKNHEKNKKYFVLKKGYDKAFEDANLELDFKYQESSYTYVGSDDIEDRARKDWDEAMLKTYKTEKIDSKDHLTTEFNIKRVQDIIKKAGLSRRYKGHLYSEPSDIKVDKDIISTLFEQHSDFLHGIESAS